MNCGVRNCKLPAKWVYKEKLLCTKHWNLLPAFEKHYVAKWLKDGE